MKIHFEKYAKSPKNGEKGITLIALVITIIVLLILARHRAKHAHRRQQHFEESDTS